MKDYSRETEVQYSFPPDKLHGDGGKVKPEILVRLYDELELNPRARAELCKFLHASLWQGQAAKVWFLGEEMAQPSDDPDPKRKSKEGPWIERQWRRCGNIWMLHLIEKLGIDEPTGKMVVANVAVIVKIAGGEERTILLEVDDYLANRSGRMTQSELRGLVRDRLFSLAAQKAFRA